ILLHLTSLPGQHGIGSIGEPARTWLRWLGESGCGLWQFLPIGPTGYGDSPYQMLSAFAGNPLLIDLDDLVERGLLDRAELSSFDFGDADGVDYATVLETHGRALNLAADAFRHGQAGSLRPGFEEYKQSHSDWLDDYSLFMALKERHHGLAWTEWPAPLARREPAALAQATDEHRDRIEAHRFIQFLFDLQWECLRTAAAESKVTLLGDLPIFVAHDSADVWSNQSLFKLTEEGRPAAVAGVPPDYFSEDGQLWGVPIYRWEQMAETGFDWWRRRVRRALSRMDWIRLDHFRGFHAHWEVPAGSASAREGRWVPGPGLPLFEALVADHGPLPFVAEDLGVITDQVKSLRHEIGLPGMKVLQFAFGDDSNNPYLPHNYSRGWVVYTGTHDNNTTSGWYENAPKNERDFCLRYLGTSGDQIPWDLIRLAWSSVADWAVAPMQDFLGLGSRARMNVPGQSGGNWRWRLSSSQLTTSLANRIREMNGLYGRA
ncbi:MAG: 4-alpha-glucanotransferase, partial [Anaerolineales bacterium]